MNNYKHYKLLFFYPSGEVDYTGGFIWMQKVAENIEKTGKFSVKNINSEKIPEKLFFAIAKKIKVILWALCSSLDYVLLDSFGETNIIFWIILKLFVPKCKIVLIFH